MMTPLAERMRPRSLTDYLGQSKLIGPDGILRKIILEGSIHSMILWGPPGVGKTTLAQIIATAQDRPFHSLSAINSGVKDVRETIQKAKSQQFFNRPGPILFIDEIHRFSKSQQDSLLGAVEKGIITLIGATTENPSFEVISALLSRCQVYVLEPLNQGELKQMILNSFAKDTKLKTLSIQLKEDDAIYKYSGGDARKAYNIVDILTSNLGAGDSLTITNDLVEDKLQHNILLYDKGGDQHYDILSAFIKSIRGSDPNATVYWLGRMLQGGEDIKIIARRMIISASEDIGLANPNALLMANTCFDAITKIGMPEARIILSQCAIYLANSEKSNASYIAIGQAMATAKEQGNLPVPLHLRNAPTKLMKSLDFGRNYKYAHDYEESFVQLQYLPDKIKNESFYKPANNTQELRQKDRLNKLWKGYYNFDSEPKSK